MGIEIERKFLVHVDRLPTLEPSAAVEMTQGYLADSPTVRVRVGTDTDGTARGWLTIKAPGMLARAEFEYEVPAEDARSILSLAHARISKVRYRVPHAGHTWEVDRFDGALEGLWLAEIELDRPDETFERPSWIDEEVTEDPRYSNGALARTQRIPSRQ